MNCKHTRQGDRDLSFLTHRDTISWNNVGFMVDQCHMRLDNSKITLVQRRQSHVSLYAVQPFEEGACGPARN